MKPMNKHDIFPLVIEETGFDEVEDVVNFYYKEVAACARNLVCLNLRIEEIGQLRIAKTKLDRIEENTIRFLSTLEENTDLHKFFSQRLEKINNLKKLRQEEYDKRQAIQEKKDNHKAKTAVEIKKENS